MSSSRSFTHFSEVGSKCYESDVSCSYKLTIPTNVREVQDKNTCSCMRPIMSSKHCGGQSPSLGWSIVISTSCYWGGNKENQPEFSQRWMQSNTDRSFKKTWPDNGAMGGSSAGQVCVPRGKPTEHVSGDVVHKHQPSNLKKGNILIYCSNPGEQRLWRHNQESVIAVKEASAN